MVETMWVNPPGYLWRAPGMRDTQCAFTNYGVSLKRQAVNVVPERIKHLNAYFETYRPGDEYDRDAIPWVMASR